VGGGMAKLTLLGSYTERCDSAAMHRYNINCGALNKVL